MIDLMGKLRVNDYVMDLAQSIREDNYRVNTPSKYHKYQGNCYETIQQLSDLFNCGESSIDYVYFSSKEGAEPHVDKLNLLKFEEDTIIIPLILPRGKSTLRVGGSSTTLEPLLAYKFKHTIIHSLELEDTESGCVLIMAAVLK